MLDVNQDPLGTPADRVFKRDETEVWARPLEDGSMAVGLFNLGEDEAPVSVRWSELGIPSPRHLRDLWRQKDLEVQPDGITASVPRHGVVLIKAGKGL